MNILDLFRTPKPTPAEDTPAKSEDNRPKKTPIPGAPVLPKGYYYSVKVGEPAEFQSHKIEFFLWVYVYPDKVKKGNLFDSVGDAVDIQYKAGWYSGYMEKADLAETATRAYYDAFPPPIVMDIPESISDYIGDHRA